MNRVRGENFMLPMYEVRYQDCEEWKSISEIEFMDCLYKYYNKLTPAIKEMLYGKEIITPGAIYRLKLEGK